MRNHRNVLQNRDKNITSDLDLSKVTESVVKLFPQAEIALIDNTKHMLPLQDPEALGRTVVDFTRRHSRS